MKVRLHNNDSTEHIDYVGDSIEEIREQAAERITSPTWDKGWSEVLEE
jgi:hypothetical protein